MNKIHPTVQLIGDVQIGTGNEILPYAVLIGPIELGDNNFIGPHVTIGTPGQDTRNPRYECSDAPIRIGNRNIIREYTAIQKPCYREITSIGNDCFLMQSVHVPHDAIIEDHVVITPMVVMGGIVHIMEGVNLGISSSVHQYGVVGPYAILGMGAPALKNIRPFSRYVPGRPLSVNKYAVEKFGLEEYVDEIEAYVIDQVRPSSDRVIDLVSRYEDAATKSGRTEYS